MPARLQRAFVVVAAVLAAACLAAPAAMAARPGYLTIIDRSQLAQADAACQQQVGSVHMPDVLAEIARRGMTPTGSVVTSFVKETTVSCKKPALHPSWADLQAWHTQYGLELVSSGATKAEFTQIDAPHQWSESCGTLPVFQAHGFDWAWGLFNYPNDSWTVAAQSSIVSNCFAWGRDYANKINTRSDQASPWFGLDTPTATVNSGPANGTSDTTAQLTFSASSPRVTFTCSLDGAPAAPCANPASYTGLAAGPHTLQVWPADALGNRGSAATWSWSIAG